MKPVSTVEEVTLPNPTPPPLRATFPFRRGFSYLRAFAPSRETDFLFSSREAAEARRVQGIYGPGSDIVECAADMLRLLGHNMPPVSQVEAAE